MNFSVENHHLVIRIPLADIPVKPIQLMKPNFEQELSPRQQDVLSMVLARKNDKDMAIELGVSVSAVKKHVSALLKKFHLRYKRDIVIAWATKDLKIKDARNFYSKEIHETDFKETSIGRH